FYYRTSTASFLSNEFPEVRASTIARIGRWYEAANGKSAVEQRWLALPEVGIYPALELLKNLAKERHQKPKVLAELNRMFKDRHWVFQPHVAELMADLGDRSKVAEVLDHHRKGKYS